MVVDEFGAVHHQPRYFRAFAFTYTFNRTTEIVQKFWRLLVIFYIRKRVFAFVEVIIVAVVV